MARRFSPTKAIRTRRGPDGHFLSKRQIAGYRGVLTRRRKARERKLGRALGWKEFKGQSTLLLWRKMVGRYVTVGRELPGGTIPENAIPLLPDMWMQLEAMRGEPEHWRAFIIYSTVYVNGRVTGPHTWSTPAKEEQGEVREALERALVELATPDLVEGEQPILGQQDLYQKAVLHSFAVAKWVLDKEATNKFERQEKRRRRANARRRRL